MITTSTDFLDAQNASAIYSRVAGTIYTKTGNIYSIDESNIIPSTLSIQNKCLNGSYFEYGAVYCAEMNISLKLDNIDRYSLFDATVELFYYLRLENGTEEAVKLGTWIVAEPTRTKKIVALKCYDIMTNFDKDIDIDTYGTAYELLNFCCTKCNVVLGSTESEINALINSSDNLYCYMNEIATYRDLIAYICIVTSTFATIDRNGELRLVTFDKEPVKTIPVNKIVASTIHDYTTYYAGIEGRFLANKNYAPYDYKNENSTGLMLDIGDIPIVYGDNVYKNKLLENIYTTDLSLINYTPCSLDIVTDATLELGDMITVENANGTQDSINAIITSITFSHHNTMKIESAGSNPKLKIASKTEKSLANVTGVGGSSTLEIYKYTNSNKITLSSADERIALLKYLSNDDSVILFNCTFTVDAEPESTTLTATDSNGNTVTIPVSGTTLLTITYVSNLDRITTHIPVTELRAGKNIITLHYAFDVEENEANIFEVLANISNGTATIDIGQVIASIMGSNLGGVAEWNGVILAEDVMNGSIRINGSNVYAFTSNVEAGVQYPKSAEIAEIFSGFRIGGSIVKGFTDNITINAITESYNINTSTNNTSYDVDFINIKNGVFELQTNYDVGTSTQSTIDRGYLSKCNIDLTRFDEVQSVEFDTYIL